MRLIALFATAILTQCAYAQPTTSGCTVNSVDTSGNLVDANNNIIGYYDPYTCWMVSTGTCGIPGFTPGPAALIDGKGNYVDESGNPAGSATVPTSYSLHASGLYEDGWEIIQAPFTGSITTLRPDASNINTYVATTVSATSRVNVALKNPTTGVLRVYENRQCQIMLDATIPSNGGLLGLAGGSTFIGSNNADLDTRALTAIIGSSAFVGNTVTEFNAANAKKVSVHLRDVGTTPIAYASVGLDFDSATPIAVDTNGCLIRGISGSTGFPISGGASTGLFVDATGALLTGPACKAVDDNVMSSSGGMLSTGSTDVAFMHGLLSSQVTEASSSFPNGGTTVAVATNAFATAPNPDLWFARLTSTTDNLLVDAFTGRLIDFADGATGGIITVSTTTPKYLSSYITGLGTNADLSADLSSAATHMPTTLAVYDSFTQSHSSAVAGRSAADAVAPPYTDTSIVSGKQVDNDGFYLDGLSARTATGTSTQDAQVVTYVTAEDHITSTTTTVIGVRIIVAPAVVAEGKEWNFYVSPTGATRTLYAVGQPGDVIRAATSFTDVTAAATAVVVTAPLFEVSEFVADFKYSVKPTAAALAAGFETGNVPTSAFAPLSGQTRWSGDEACFIDLADGVCLDVQTAADSTASGFFSPSGDGLAVVAANDFTAATAPDPVEPLDVAKLAGLAGDFSSTSSQFVYVSTVPTSMSVMFRPDGSYSDLTGSIATVPVQYKTSNYHTWNLLNSGVNAGDVVMQITIAASTTSLTLAETTPFTNQIVTLDTTGYSGPLSAFFPKLLAGVVIDSDGFVLSEDVLTVSIEACQGHRDVGTSCIVGKAGETVDLVYAQQHPITGEYVSTNAAGIAGREVIVGGTPSAPTFALSTETAISTRFNGLSGTQRLAVVGNEILYFPAGAAVGQVVASDCNPSTKLCTAFAKLAEQGGVLEAVPLVVGDAAFEKTVTAKTTASSVFGYIVLGFIEEPVLCPAGEIVVVDNNCGSCPVNTYQPVAESTATTCAACPGLGANPGLTGSFNAAGDTFTASTEGVAKATQCFCVDAAGAAINAHPVSDVLPVCPTTTEVPPCGTRAPTAESIKSFFAKIKSASDAASTMKFWPVMYMMSDPATDDGFVSQTPGDQNSLDNPWPHPWRGSRVQWNGYASDNTRANFGLPELQDDTEYVFYAGTKPTQGQFPNLLNGNEIFVDISGTITPNTYADGTSNRIYYGGFGTDSGAVVGTSMTVFGTGWIREDAGQLTPEYSVLTVRSAMDPPANQFPLVPYITTWSNSQKSPTNSLISLLDGLPLTDLLGAATANAATLFGGSHTPDILDIENVEEQAGWVYTKTAGDSVGKINWYTTAPVFSGCAADYKLGLAALTCQTYAGGPPTTAGPRALSEDGTQCRCLENVPFSAVSLPDYPFGEQTGNIQCVKYNDFVIATLPDSNRALVRSSDLKVTGNDQDGWVVTDDGAGAVSATIFGLYNPSSKQWISTEASFPGQMISGTRVIDVSDLSNLKFYDQATVPLLAVAKVPKLVNIADDPGTPEDESFTAPTPGTAANPFVLSYTASSEDVVVAEQNYLKGQMVGNVENAPSLPGTLNRPVHDEATAGPGYPIFAGMYTGAALATLEWRIEMPTYTAVGDPEQTAKLQIWRLLDGAADFQAAGETIGTPAGTCNAATQQCGMGESLVDITGKRPAAVKTVTNFGANLATLDSVGGLTTDGGVLAPFNPTTEQIMSPVITVSGESFGAESSLILNSAGLIRTEAFLDESVDPEVVAARYVSRIILDTLPSGAEGCEFPGGSVLIDVATGIAAGGGAGPINACGPSTVKYGVCNPTTIECVSTKTGSPSFDHVVLGNGEFNACPEGSVCGGFYPDGVKRLPTSLILPTVTEPTLRINVGGSLVVVADSCNPTTNVCVGTDSINYGERVSSLVADAGFFTDAPLSFRLRGSCTTKDLCVLVAESVSTDPPYTGASPPTIYAKCNPSIVLKKSAAGMQDVIQCVADSGIHDGKPIWVNGRRPVNGDGDAITEVVGFDGLPSTGLAGVTVGLTSVQSGILFHDAMYCSGLTRVCRNINGRVVNYDGVNTGYFVSAVAESVEVRFERQAVPVLGDNARPLVFIYNAFVYTNGVKGAQTAACNSLLGMCVLSDTAGVFGVDAGLVVNMNPVEESEADVIAGPNDYAFTFDHVSNSGLLGGVVLTEHNFVTDQCSLSIEFTEFGGVFNVLFNAQPFAMGADLISETTALFCFTEDSATTDRILYHLAPLATNTATPKYVDLAFVDTFSQPNLMIVDDLVVATRTILSGQWVTVWTPTKEPTVVDSEGFRRFGVEIITYSYESDTDACTQFGILRGSDQSVAAIDGAEAECSPLENLCWVSGDAFYVFDKSGQPLSTDAALVDVRTTLANYQSATISGMSVLIGATAVRTDGTQDFVVAVGNPLTAQLLWVAGDPTYRQPIQMQVIRGEASYNAPYFGAARCIAEPLIQVGVSADGEVAGLSEGSHCDFLRDHCIAADVTLWNEFQQPTFFTGPVQFVPAEGDRPAEILVQDGATFEGNRLFIDGPSNTNGFSFQYRAIRGADIVSAGGRCDPLIGSCTIGSAVAPTVFLAKGGESYMLDSNLAAGSPRNVPTHASPIERFHQTPMGGPQLVGPIVYPESPLYTVEAGRITWPVGLRPYRVCYRVHAPAGVSLSQNFNTFCESALTGELSGVPNIPFYNTEIVLVGGNVAAEQSARQPRIIEVGTNQFEIFAPPQLEFNTVQLSTAAYPAVHRVLEGSRILAQVNPAYGPYGFMTTGEARLATASSVARDRGTSLVFAENRFWLIQSNTMPVQPVRVIEALRVVNGALIAQVSGAAQIEFGACDVCTDQCFYSAQSHFRIQVGIEDVDAIFLNGLPTGRRTMTNRIVQNGMTSLIIGNDISNITALASNPVLLRVDQTLISNDEIFATVAAPHDFVSFDESLSACAFVASYELLPNAGENSFSLALNGARPSTDPTGAICYSEASLSTCEIGESGCVTSCDASLGASCSSSEAANLPCQFTWDNGGCHTDRCRVASTDDACRAGETCTTTTTNAEGTGVDTIPCQLVVGDNAGETCNVGGGGNSGGNSPRAGYFCLEPVAGGPCQDSDASLCLLCPFAFLGGCEGNCRISPDTFEPSISNVCLTQNGPFGMACSLGDTSCLMYGQGSPIACTVEDVTGLRRSSVQMRSNLQRTALRNTGGGGGGNIVVAGAVYNPVRRQFSLRLTGDSGFDNLGRISPGGFFRNAAGEIVPSDQAVAAGRELEAAPEGSAPFDLLQGARWYNATGATVVLAPTLVDISDTGAFTPFVYSSSDQGLEIAMVTTSGFYLNVPAKGIDQATPLLQQGAANNIEILSEATAGRGSQAVVRVDPASSPMAYEHPFLAGQLVAYYKNTTRGVLGCTPTNGVDNDCDGLALVDDFGHWLLNTEGQVLVAPRLVKNKRTFRCEWSSNTNALMYLNVLDNRCYNGPNDAALQLDAFGMYAVDAQGARVQPPSITAPEGIAISSGVTARAVIPTASGFPATITVGSFLVQGSGATARTYVLLKKDAFKSGLFFTTNPEGAIMNPSGFPDCIASGCTLDGFQIPEKFFDNDRNNIILKKNGAVVGFARATGLLLNLDKKVVNEFGVLIDIDGNGIANDDHPLMKVNLGQSTNNYQIYAEPSIRALTGKDFYGYYHPAVQVAVIGEEVFFTTSVVDIGSITSAGAIVSVVIIDAAGVETTPLGTGRGEVIDAAGVDVFGSPTSKGEDELTGEELAALSLVVVKRQDPVLDDEVYTLVIRGDLNNTITYGPAKDTTELCQYEGQHINCAGFYYDFNSDKVLPDVVVENVFLPPFNALNQSVNAEGVVIAKVNAAGQLVNRLGQLIYPNGALILDSSSQPIVSTLTVVTSTGVVIQNNSRVGSQSAMTGLVFDFNGCLLDATGSVIDEDEDGVCDRAMPLATVQTQANFTVGGQQRSTDRFIQSNLTSTIGVRTGLSGRNNETIFLLLEVSVVSTRAVERAAVASRGSVDDSKFMNVRQVEYDRVRPTGLLSNTKAAAHGSPHELGTKKATALSSILAKVKGAHQTETRAAPVNKFKQLASSNTMAEDSSRRLLQTGPTTNVYVDQFGVYYDINGDGIVPDMPLALQSLTFGTGNTNAFGLAIGETILTDSTTQSQYYARVNPVTGLNVASQAGFLIDTDGFLIDCNNDGQVPDFHPTYDVSGFDSSSGVTETLVQWTRCGTDSPVNGRISASPLQQIYFEYQLSLASTIQAVVDLSGFFVDVDSDGAVPDAFGTIPVLPTQPTQSTQPTQPPATTPAPTTPAPTQATTPVCAPMASNGDGYNVFVGTTEVSMPFQSAALMAAFNGNFTGYRVYAQGDSAASVDYTGAVCYSAASNGACALGEQGCITSCDTSLDALCANASAAGASCEIAWEGTGEPSSTCSTLDVFGPPCTVGGSCVMLDTYSSGSVSCEIRVSVVLPVGPQVGYTIPREDNVWYFFDNHLLFRGLLAYYQPCGGLRAYDGTLVDFNGRFILPNGQIIDELERLVDDKGRLIDADGNLIDEEGNLIDDANRLVDEQGRLIDSEGRLINEDGHLIDEQGRLVNEDGHLVNEVGKLINADGNLVNEFGEIVDSDGDRVCFTSTELFPFYSDAKPASLIDGADGGQDFNMTTHNNTKYNPPRGYSSVIAGVIVFTGGAHSSIRCLPGGPMAMLPTVMIMVYGFTAAVYHWSYLRGWWLINLVACVMALHTVNMNVADTVVASWRRAATLRRGQSALVTFWTLLVVVHMLLLLVASALRIPTIDNPDKQADFIYVLYILPYVLLMGVLVGTVRIEKLIDCIGCEMYWVPYRAMFATVVAFLLAVLDYWSDSQFAYIAQVHAFWILSNGYLLYCLASLGLYMKAKNCGNRVTATFWPKPRSCRYDLVPIFPIVKVLGPTIAPCGMSIAEGCVKPEGALSIAGPDVGGDIELHPIAPEASLAVGGDEHYRPSPLNFCKIRFERDDFTYEVALEIARLISDEFLPYSYTRAEYVRLCRAIELKARMKPNSIGAVCMLRLMRFATHLIGTATKQGRCTKGCGFDQGWVRDAYDKRDSAVDSKCEANIGRMPTAHTRTYSDEEILEALISALAKSGVSDPESEAEQTIENGNYDLVHRYVKDRLRGITVAHIRNSFA
jgi:hypothetical protein